MGSEEPTDQNDTQEQPVDTEESLIGEVVDEAVASEATGEVNLAAELETAKSAASDNWDKLLLAKAEVENIRRRTQKDIEKAHRFSIERFAKDMLPVVDSLEMGLAATNESEADTDGSALKEGMELTYKQLISSLEKSGVVQVDPEGETFSPDLHQAISVVPSPDHAPNTVMQVFQKGYTLNGRLLRPAMVIVTPSEPPAGAKKIDEQA
ncbi:MAG TPA: nucleotide exchange factor GrpE [Cycloclasticus sp.]|jgi:molecular chaperone GrpE|nr:nucleotide exchange factor GrpE [Cycloclasticus sp.]HIL92582.1 nucleotide exchange factor GrpE [Cycloclasticus sp.]